MLKKMVNVKIRRSYLNGLHFLYGGLIFSFLAIITYFTSALISNVLLSSAWKEIQKLDPSLGSYSFKWPSIPMMFDPNVGTSNESQEISSIFFGVSVFNMLTIFIGMIGMLLIATGVTYMITSYFVYRKNPSVVINYNEPAFNKAKLFLLRRILITIITIGLIAFYIWIGFMIDIWKRNDFKNGVGATIPDFTRVMTICQVVMNYAIGLPFTIALLCLVQWIMFENAPDWKAKEIRRQARIQRAKQTIVFKGMKR